MSASRDRRALGFITPLTHNFCESCNRVRVTCTGTLYMCLGQEDAADLRAPLRASESNERLAQAHRRGDRAQAEGARFHHRPRDLPPGCRAAYERHGRLNQAERRLDAKRSISLRRVLDWLASSDERLSISLPERLS